MKFLVIWGAVLVAGFTGLLIYPYLPEMPKAGVAPAHQPPPMAKTGCEDRATLETLKELANRKIRASGSSAYEHEVVMAAIRKEEDYAFSAFRERGRIGKGFTCAAMITVRAPIPSGYWPPGRSAPNAEIDTEYSVEPTTDGKMMVSARFMPN
jgi:hypothetical protein